MINFPSPFVDKDAWEGDGEIFDEKQ